MLQNAACKTISFSLQTPIFPLPTELLIILIVNTSDDVNYWMVSEDCQLEGLILYMHGIVQQTPQLFDLPRHAVDAYDSQPLDNVQQQYSETSSPARVQWLGNGIHR